MGTEEPSVLRAEPAEGAGSPGRLPGAVEEEAGRGRSRRGLLAGGSKQLQEGLLIPQTKTSRVLEREREAGVLEKPFSSGSNICGMTSVVVCGVGSFLLSNSRRLHRAPFAKGGNALTSRIIVFITH